MENEQALLEALREGNAAAFQQLFDTYSDKLYRLAAGLLQDDAEAESVVQDSFLRLIEHLDRFEGRSKVGTWLYRVAYNASMDQLRKRRPFLPLASEMDDEGPLPSPTILTDWRNVPERRLTEAEVSAELNRAISTLPEKLRAIFILYEVEGLSHAESAEVLDISISAAKVRLHRARLALRERLAAYFTEFVT